MKDISENVSDEQLLDELRKRFKDREQALQDLRAVTKKLEHLNAKLKESEDLKSNFLSNIRNEINNPLASIVGLSGQMADGTIDRDKYVSTAHMIFLEAFELDFQLKNIFVAAELEAGDTELSPALINVGTFVNKTIDMFHYISERRSIQAKISFSEEGCAEGEDTFHTDPEKLHMILANLISNALEFSSENTEVVIHIKKDNSSLQISVSDQGPGISPKDQEVIFDRFKQLSTGARKTHRGHGIGLCIVKSLLDVLGGSVQVISDIGKGSTFVVTLPELQGSEGEGVYSEDGNEFIFDDDNDAEVQRF